MVDFFEDQGDFMDFEGSEDEMVDECVCNECGNTFTVSAGEEPDECPICGIDFDD